MMTKLELLASDIALLSNDSLQKLAMILVRDYAPRADVLSTQIDFMYQDQFNVLATQQSPKREYHVV